MQGVRPTAIDKNRMCKQAFIEPALRFLLSHFSPMCSIFAHSFYSSPISPSCVSPYFTLPTILPYFTLPLSHQFPISPSHFPSSPLSLPPLFSHLLYPPPLFPHLHHHFPLPPPLSFLQALWSTSSTTVAVVPIDDCSAGQNLHVLYRDTAAL
jgi:hypothetical protein